MENRIKEQLMLFSDRTSSHYLRSNQLPVVFFFDRLRAVCRCCGDWDCKEPSWQGQCSTIRLKLLKIGALIRITIRKVWISLAGG